MLAPPSQVPTLEDIRAQRSTILAIALSHGARNVRVTGSVARGDASADSDVDLIVDLDEDRDVADLSVLILDLQDALGRRVDVLEVRRASPVAQLTLRDAVPL
jgi:predicted nucleotidyltransferase